MYMNVITRCLCVTEQAREDLKAKWLPFLQKKVAKRPACGNAQAAAGGIRKKTAKKARAQGKRKRKLSGSSSSSITIADAALRSLVENDGADNDGPEGVFCSRRSPPSVATRAPRPRRRAAQVANENCRAWAESLCEMEEDPDGLH